MNASDTWADALRFPPWIEDGDGTVFNRAFQLSHDAGHRRSDSDGLALSDLHSPASTSEGQVKHAA